MPLLHGPDFRMLRHATVKVESVQNPGNLQTDRLFNVSRLSRLAGEQFPPSQLVEGDAPVQYPVSPLDASDPHELILLREHFLDHGVEDQGTTIGVDRPEIELLGGPVRRALPDQP